MRNLIPIVQQQRIDCPFIQVRVRQPGCSTGVASNSGLATPDAPSTPVVAHGTATPPVAVDPTLVNSCLALPDLRMKKKDRKRKGRHREGALKDLSRFLPRFFY